MRDEQAWLVAGRLYLVDHLAEARGGWSSEREKWNQHQKLLTFGYTQAALNACRCGLGLSVVEVPLGTIKVAQIVS